MKLEDQVRQLTELMAVLVPVVDRLAVGQDRLEKIVDKLATGQEKAEKSINSLTQIAEKSNLEMSEMRLSNMRLAEAIEKLVTKIDKI